MPSSDVGAGVVISGIAGRFPRSDNMREFARNLYEKQDLVDDQETRWRHVMPDVPRRTGKINNLDKFDGEFFGISRRQRDTMDPQQRLAIEHAFEAILDAGLNPETIRGSRTGVFCGVCFSETEVQMFYRVNPQKGLGILGCAKSLLVNNISYILDLKGPAIVIDTACSSSMYALDVAYRNMLNGTCDSALVLGANLTLHPYITYQFALLGVLAKDGYCRPFDKDASGYSRSEAVCAVFLQKQRDAKRVYCSLIHSKTNCDGFKSEGITYPSGAVQKQLLQEFYNEVGISPTRVDYVEAHSTGTIVGDPEECAAIDEVYCKGRDRPLPVGSVKSSIGHSEAAAGVCSIAKSIIAMENWLIPPNINFVENRPSIPSLVEGRLKVVHEATPLPGPLIGINSFGFGGANAHALLRSNLKEKKNHGLPDDDLPRLVVWSGRTKEAIEAMLHDVASRPLDTEFIALLHNIQRQAIPGHRYRGYGIFKANGDKPAILQESHTERIRLDPLPLVVVCGGVNKQWRNDLDALKKFSAVESTVVKCLKVLASLKFDLSRIPPGGDTILNNMVGTAILQLSTVDLLTSIGVKFDLYGGHSVGQLTCAYIDGLLSLEQVIQLAFWYGLLYLECQAISDTCAFVKLNTKLNQCSWNGIVKDTASTFAVIRGSQQIISEQIRKLGSEGFVTEELSFASLRCESSKEAFLANKLRQTVNAILTKTILPTSRWITSKLPQTSSIFHSPKLHASCSIINLLEKIPKHTHVMEIGSNTSCERVLEVLNRRSCFIPAGLVNPDVTCKLLSTMGQLYFTTQSLRISDLYPAVQFPVSRGTPMISPLIRWDHRETAFVVKYGWEGDSASRISSFKISLAYEGYKFISGHCIDGRVLFPATGYLQLVWDHIASITHRILLDLPVVFEDVRFLRATTIPKGQSVELIIMMQDVSGFFEILEGDSVVVTGYVRIVQNIPKETITERFSAAPIVPTKDFYKELRLRGYHYTEVFKSVLEARSDGSGAKIQWTGNWVALLDCMLQVGIIAIDTRSLMVPTAIEKLTIDPKAHMAMVETDGDETEFLTMRTCLRTNVSVCGGVVLSNPRANIVGRRNPPGVPVLETYQFVPYFSDQRISTLEAVRMSVQLALENVPMMSVTVAEVHSERFPVLVQLFGEAISDLPSVRSTLSLLTDKELDLTNITVKNEKLEDQTNLLFVILDSKLAEPKFLQEASSSLVESGFILLRDSESSKDVQFQWTDKFNTVAMFSVEQEETLTLLQLKSKSFNETPAVFQVQSTDFEWLVELKQAIRFKPVILYSQNDSTSGVIGLVNCIRREPKLQNVRCVFVDDPNAPEFSLNEPFYQAQLNLGLAINVYKNGAWGSYRHALLAQSTITESVDHHCYANCLTKGDLSSMVWFTGAMNEVSKVRNKVRVMYSALNFRDVMVATGRLSSDILTSNRLEEECELGYEFSGVTEDGRRVMGALGFGALATMVESDPLFMWTVPDEWSLEEACTVPVVYGTVLLAFFICTKIRPGKSILIHAGSGGVGLAAIQVALANGLEVFTTVSTEEKRDFLLDRFPALKRENIGNSRNVSFEQMIKCRTNGKGVDYVLNSLSEEKLQASVRCLGKGGHFLEIGKYDMASNSKLAMQLFQKGLTFTSVMLDMMFNETPEMKKGLHKLMTDALARGTIKPLTTTVYDAVDLEKAMRYLASGKHTGKILLKIRQNETDVQTLPISYVHRVYCNPDNVYIIVGGLGGFGLELADWLVLRGCRKIVLSSRKGISKPYQQYRIKVWKNYGVQVVISTADVTTQDGVRSLIQEASKLGVVSGIYNLAVKLLDAILDNQTPELFEQCLAPKAIATKYLDIVSRQLCPQLKQFVVFSSVSCGRGNAGQSNYGMANSIMERIVEQRKAQGLPAKAIQWGAIGEVGLVADMAEDKIDMEIGGTLQQRISSCLQEMDRLLTCDDPIVASMVVAEKRASSGTKNIIEAVMNIMSIRELKSVSMESTLADIGMDSLMAVEIKQVLERDFELLLSPQELRTLTFEKLLKLEEEKKKVDSEVKHGSSNVVMGVEMLLRNLGCEETCDKTILRLSSASDKGQPVLIIPGLEGMAGNVWDTIAKEIHAPVFLLQLFNTIQCDNIPAIIDCVFDELLNTVFKGHDTFAIIAYSFGAIIAIEIVKRLQAKQMRGKLLLIDGAPKFSKILARKQFGENPTDRDIQKALMLGIISIVFPNQPIERVLSIVDVSSFEGQIDKLVELAKEINMYSPNYTRKMTQALFKRIKMVVNLNLDEDQPLDLPITLVRPSEVSYGNIEDDYGLASYTTGDVALRIIQGSHITMLENPALIEIINSFSL